MQLTKYQCKTIENALDDCGFQLHESYSGRGMYGKECFGFSAEENGAVEKFISALFSNASDYDEIIDILNTMGDCASTDSLGLGTIYYYKSIKWLKGCDEDEEDSE